MTPDEEELSVRRIEIARRINRLAAAKYVAHGVSAEDVAIAAIYSAHDLAMAAGRDPHAAIEWLRTALDLQERQLLKNGKRLH